MAKLSKGLQRFFELMRDHAIGDVLTRDEILIATGWSESSFTTYLRKNKFSAFLEITPNGRFKVLKHGPSLTEGDVQGALSQVTPQAMALLKGEKIVGSSATYVLARQIGQGAVGHVWEATTEATGQRVALKIVNPRIDLLEPEAFDEVRERFRREARHGLKLQDDAVIRYIDHGTHRKAPFLVMELAIESVADMLERGPLSVEQSASLISRCVSALRYLHSQHCIHRDVKPANILKCARGFVLGDLGIARWSDLNPSFTNAGTLTRTAVQLGSWYYMAPEQQSTPHEAVPLSDVYALGVTWYELLTAKTPPPPPVFAAQRAPSPCANAELHRMISKMTAFDPEDRPGLAEIASFASSLEAKRRRK
jgi:serine/threonine protein kinase